MLLEGIAGLLAIIAVTIFVTKFVLEAMHLPVMSDQEWDIVRAKRPDVGDVEMGNLVR